jgi:hypothetical protein
MKIDLWFDCLRMRRSSVEVDDSQQRSSTATEWRIGEERRKLFSQTTDSMRHNGGRDRKQRKRVSTYYNSVKQNIINYF